jgi:hypothetical protein
MSSEINGVLKYLIAIEYTQPRKLTSKGEYETLFFLNPAMDCPVSMSETRHQQRLQYDDYNQAATHLKSLALARVQYPAFHLLDVWINRKIALLGYYPRRPDASLVVEFVKGTRLYLYKAMVAPDSQQVLVSERVHDSLLFEWQSAAYV